MEDYQSKADQISQLSALPPDQLVNHFSSAYSNVQNAAPNIAIHLQSTAARAMQFLQSKLPPKSDSLIEDRKSEPSETQKRQFLQYHETLNDPISVLDHVKNNTLTQNHLDALEAVYPDLHQEMKKKMLDKLIETKSEGKSLNYKARNSVSQFLGQPLDSTQTQPMMASIIAANAPKSPPPAPVGGQKKVSKSTASTMEKSTALLQTPDQARAANRMKA